MENKSTVSDGDAMPPLVDLMKIILSAGVMAADSSHINVAQAAYRTARNAGVAAPDTSARDAKGGA